MRLTRLRLSQVRKFTGSLVIPSFEPGLNVICGPNEAGKSTIVRAIRAAFFERHRSGVVEDLLPTGETSTSASPTVEIAFDIDETSYVLTKSFFHRKRCTLTGGPTVLDSDLAEEAVAQLLSFSYAGKGLSKPEHWGIPGLLWIDQGASHEVSNSVEHAADRLLTALESTVGAVASGAGDEVLALVRTERDKLLTGGAKPRGDYDEAQKDLANVRQVIAELDERIRRYEQDVDRFGTLQAKHAVDAREKPWEGFRVKLEAAQAALTDAQQLEGRLKSDVARAKQLDQTRKVLEEQVREFARLREAKATREDDLRKAREAEGIAQAALGECERRRDEANDALRRATDVVAAAQTEQRRRELEERREAASREEERLTTAVQGAESDARQVAALDAEAKEYQVGEEDLEELEACSEQIRALETKRELASTSLTFVLDPSTRIQLNGQAIEPQSEQRIAEKAVVSIGELGTITVEPGAGNLAEINAQLAEARRALAAVLGRIGVSTREDARARRTRATKAAEDAKNLRKLLKVRAPKGVDALRTDLATSTAAKKGAEEALAALPELTDGPSVSFEEARRACEAATTLAQDAGTKAVDASQNLVECRARREHAETELQAVQERLNDEKNAEREHEVARQLQEVQDEAVTLKGAIGELEAKVEALQPELLKQDVQRLSDSADKSQKAFIDLEIEIGTLLGNLNREGALGLEEQREERRGAERSAVRRLAEIELRAKALDLLVRRMEEKREALTRRLQAPLQRRLDHYIRILFPQGRMGLNEDLTPGSLSRGPETVDFVQLSYGAKEQTALISRLAYADLLKEAGNPTLLMLDDALVHSDGVRLEQMKRVIFDGATRHQILFFTCHPERWDGLGATARDVRSFVSGVPAVANVD